jgi:hypothetical protein
MSTINQLQRRIMRRVYYAFGIKLLTHRVTLHAFVFTLGLYGLGVMVHVASFIQNLKSMQLQYVDNFMFNALTHTDVYTLLFVGIVVFSALSFNFSLLRVPKYHRRMQAV